MKKLACLLTIACFVGSLSAQMKGTGAYPFSSLDNKGFDTINLGNLDTHFEIPIVARPGRGLAFNYSMVYDSLLWTPVTANSITTWQPDSSFGFHGQLAESITGYLTNSVETLMCGRATQPSYVQTNFVYHDSFGIAHGLPYFPGFCGAKPTIGQSPDGSGYSYDGAYVRDRYGRMISAPLNPAKGSIGTGNVTDPKGNRITNNGDGTYTDTLGIKALAISGAATSTSPLLLTYPVTLQSDSATTASSTISYKQYTVRTNFQCAGIVESGSTPANLVDRVTLADGTFYSFTYESTPSATDGAVTARVASITLPTGGLISYQYTGGCNGSGINADGTTSGLTRTTTDGRKTYVRAVVNATATSTTVTDEKSNITVYQFSEDTGTSQFYETHRQIYQGSQSAANLLMDQSTCYNGATSPCDGGAMALPILNTTIVSSYNGGSQETTKNIYSTSGLLTYSAVLSGTSTLTSTTIAYNGFGEVTSFFTSDGSGNTVSSTTYGYDETAPTTTSGIPQHTAPGTAEGNQTSSHILAGSTTINTTTTYYDTGVPIAVTTPNGTTQYGYDATQTFATTTTLPTPSSGVALSTSATYDTQSAMPVSATGMNTDKVTVINYDRLLRPLLVSMPDGGSTTYSYSSPVQVGVKQAMTQTSSTDTETLYDGYGRVSRVAVQNGQSMNPFYQTDYCYDASGLLMFQSVAYQGTGWETAKQCSGTGTTYSYDALGRVTSIQTGDGTATTQYTNRAILAKDVNGVQRITQYDLLGRISAVCEISSKTLAVGGTPASCGTDISGTGFLTTYAYDLLNHKTTITQGAQTRTFTTDAVGRPTDVVEPERGETTYSYSYNSTGLLVTRTRPQANQTSPTTHTTTTTQYDSLGRVLSVNYDDNLTPHKAFAYDAGCCSWTQPVSNVKGRLVAIGAELGSSTATLSGSSFSYDPMGRVTTIWSCAPSTCGTTAQTSRPISYTYDFAGNVTSEWDPQAGNITYGRSPAGELTSVTNKTYTLSGASGSVTLLSNPTNGPNGQISYTLGNGLSQFNSYDSLGRLNGGWVCVGAPSGACSNPNVAQRNGYYVSWSGSRAIASGENYVGQGITYQYDDFNRLSGMQNPSSQTTYSYVYDRYGNRWQQNVIAGSGSSSQLSFNSANNHVVSNSYDAAGNEVYDGVHNYTFDAEGNILQVDAGQSNSWSFVFDALNHRVRAQYSGGVSEAVFDIAGRATSGWSGATTPSESHIFADNQQLAFRSGDGHTYFVHQNWMGTDRVHTDLSGVAGATYTSLPFSDGGSENVSENYAGWDFEHFGTLDVDYWDNTYHAQFRNYSQMQGHWLSPDLYDGSYDYADPQTFNRYTYAMDDPLVFIDPVGLFSLPPSQPDPCDDYGVCVFDPPQSPTGPGGGSAGGAGAGGAGQSFAASKVPANPCAYAGRAPDPSVYAQKGQAGSSNAFTDIYNLLQFRRGAALDAQVRYGGAPSYANYTFGVYMSAAGYTLNQTLALADIYAQYRSSYPVGTPMAGPNYPFTPQANVSNITNGFNAQTNGTTCHVGG